eukprot:TRINITY_DN13794_c0_g2_i2.p2 TRINITY_DN13794_c0_g2~~TRINITY_DN13794_c0_g2_i2.p2  ORF type:complete len:161 (-),score=31.93 TRINITY_DN13794_c0_g2_i2:310-792(-)
MFVVLVFIIGSTAAYDYKEKWHTEVDDKEQSRGKLIEIQSAAQIDVTRDSDGFVDALEDLFATADEHFGFGVAKLKGAAYSYDTNTISASTQQVANNLKLKDDDDDLTRATSGTADQATNIENSEGEPIFLEQLNIIETEKGLTRFIGCTTNSKDGGCHR